MSGLISLRAAAAPIASGSRAFSVSAVACKVKGEKAKKAVTGVRKKQGTGFGAKGKGAARGPAALIKAGGLTLRTTLAKEPADLSDLVQLYPEALVPLNAGAAATFPRATYEHLKTFGLGKRIALELANGGLPTSVIRQATLDLVATLNAAKGKSSKNARLLLSGPRGAGKSMLMLQAAAYALEAGWVVLYVPQASKWLDSSTQFEYNAESKSFHQTELSQQILTKLAAVNKAQLAKITLPEALKVGWESFEAGTKLADVVALGAKNDRLAVPALEATVTVLSKQTAVPVLLAVDEAQAFFRTSDYRAPDYTRLEPYHLSASSLVLDLLTGRRAFGAGAVIGALSHSNTQWPVSDTLLHGIGQPTAHPVHPYTKHDEVHLANAQSGIQTVEVPLGMTGKEAAAMFEVWTRKGWATNPADDVFLGALNATAGNPGEMARGWLQSHQAHV
jgi:small subunit ribosomal protein S29